MNSLGKRRQPSQPSGSTVRPEHLRYHERKMQALLDLLAPGDEDYAIARAIDPARLPAHIAIIMDGNGRWARRRHLPRVAGHKAGVNTVRVAVETCARMGIRALTLYAF